MKLNCTKITLPLLLFLLVSYSPYQMETNNIYLKILGVAQDAGAPHPGCERECCSNLWEKNKRFNVVSLGLVDRSENKFWIFEATPDFTHQSNTIAKETGSFDSLSGIFLTHAHIGHYTGLMYLGKESVNTKHIPVYTMPKMSDFLKNNGPWSQLVNNNNIELNEMSAGKDVKFNNFKVIPILVPHRDEFSETVGYKIIGPNKSVLFIPDIDKWKKWDKDIREEIRKVDLAFLDATFYDGNELNTRNLENIPHPFVIESMELFKDLSDTDKAKVHFIHFNHTNPLLDSLSIEFKNVIEKGFNVAEEGQIFEL